MAADPARELERVVDRLRSMPLSRLTVAAPLAHAACAQILQAIDDVRPVPRLADHASGDQLAVIGRDALERRPDRAEAIEAVLVDLRRALP